MSTPNDQQPTEEELRAYFEQLRAAPVHDLLLQAFSVLGTGAEVKLGQRDARVLIDCMEALVTVGGAALEESAEQLSQAVAQLKMAQVQAERQMAAQDAQGSGEEAQHAGSGQAGFGQGQAPQPSPDAGQRQTDKLWIPGRD